MKKDKDKKEKYHESTIGKIIYGFLLFLPLFAIATTCLVNVFNQKANETTETRIEQQPIYYDSNEVNSYDDIIIGNVYLYTDNFSNSYQYSGQMGRILVTDLIHQLKPEYIIGNAVLIYMNATDIYLYNNNVYLFITDDNIPLIFTQTINNDAFNHFINFLSEYSNQEVKEYVNNEVITYVQNDIFYYSVDKVTQSPLFNWAENSIIYTGMHNFTTQLNITNTFIPLLLTYWLIISIVYFLYDIVLVMITIVHRKIHKLQDSI